MAQHRRGPACTVCHHNERWRIELLRAGGASLDALAEKFGLSRDAIHRHWTRHVTAEAKAGYLAGPMQIAEIAAKAADENASVLDYLCAVRTMLMGQLAACSEAGDARGAAIVAGQLTNVLEKIGRVTGELSALAPINVVNNVTILNSPVFARMQAAQLEALAPFPAARAAVVAAWRMLDAEMAEPSSVAHAKPERTPLVIDHVPVAPTPPY